MVELRGVKFELEIEQYNYIRSTSSLFQTTEMSGASTAFMPTV